MTSKNQESLPPYENLLIEDKDYVHQIIQDILNCRLDSVRRARAVDMEPILKLFLGSSPNKKREQLLEFLKLMPEYKTTDQEVLYRRLKALKDNLRRTEGNSDLYFYALRKYGKTSESESEILE